MKIYLLLILTFVLIGCGPSEELKSEASKACTEFVLDKMELSGYCGESNIFDIYTKKEKLVVEVGYRSKCKSMHDDSYSVRLCIYDEKNQTISLPSLFNQSEWTKN